MKKIKIAGIILAALIILIAAFSTAGEIKNARNNSYLGAEPYAGSALGGTSYEVSDMDANDSPSTGSAGKSKFNAPREIAMNEASAPENPISATDKKIIKTGNLNLKVESINKATEEISRIAKDNGGDIFSSNIYQSKNNLKSGYITLKIPFANFEKALKEMKETATLTVSESTSGQDVTEEYADLQTQIKNKQAEEQAYLKILDQAQKIQDILDVTQRLSAVRGQIERLQGRIKFMENQTSLSTITVNLSEDQTVTVVDSWRPLQIAKDAVNSLIKSSQGFISFLIILVITIIPVIILYALLAFVIYLVARTIYRKIKKRKEENSMKN